MNDVCIFASLGDYINRLIKALITALVYAGAQWGRGGKGHEAKL